MQNANLEHVNITVSNPEQTAELLCRIFGWHIRWHGEAMNGEGTTYHVGTDNSYVAVYSGKAAKNDGKRSYDRVGGLNHIAIEVEDLEAMELRVAEAGLETHSHAEYEPGKRFYFHDHDGIEYEVVSYDY